ncbi:MAG: hypothetical protein OXE57_01085 [Alphaproteobacteria bacterium]|nr:hypothetical protein [Alphaproteobacteria bacterium]
MNEPTEAHIEEMNRRGRELVDELLALLAPVGRDTALLSAMQILVSRAGVEPQELLDAITSLVSHNLCAGAPIRLIVARPDADPPAPDGTRH